MSADQLLAHATNLAIMAKPQTTKPRPPKNSVAEANGKVAVGSAQGGLAQIAEFKQSSFSGPMPHPSVLEGYDRIVPGAAERILAMAESDSKHQQAIEFASLRAAEAEIKRGQWFAFSIGITALIASMLALWMGSPAVAGVIGGTTVVGLVSVFIVGRFVKAE